jgi:hypothetical protein
MDHSMGQAVEQICDFAADLREAIGRLAEERTSELCTEQAAFLLEKREAIKQIAADIALRMLVY